MMYNKLYCIRRLKNQVFIYKFNNVKEDLNDVIKNLANRTHTFGWTTFPSQYWSFGSRSWLFLRKTWPNKKIWLHLTAQLYYSNCQEFVQLSPWVSCGIFGYMGVRIRKGQKRSALRASCSFRSSVEDLDPRLKRATTDRVHSEDNRGTFWRARSLFNPLTTLTTEGYDWGCLHVHHSALKNAFTNGDNRVCSVSKFIIQYPRLYLGYYKPARLTPEIH